MNRTRSIHGITIGVIAAIALAACGGAAPAASQDKAGQTPAVTLRLATADDDGRPGAEQIRQFAASVHELSAGKIIIQPVWEASGDERQGGWDQVVARKVVAGDFEMGMIPARAWDTMDVTSLRALQAPFLVTSDSLAAEIATSEVAGDLMAGLDKVGVTGLALAPESLRHLFALGDAPLAVKDFDGLLIRSPRSTTTWALFEALGATADDFTDPGEDEEAVIASGELGAYESSFALAGTLLARTTAIGNLPLFPKVNSLVINTAAFERLTEEQRGLLRTAAARTVDFAIGAMPDTATYADEYCRNGGRIVDADPAQLAALREAVAPVYDDLSSDPVTKTLIEDITALGIRIGAQPPAIAACAANPVPTDEAQGVGPFPDGVYRAEVTLDELVKAGVDRPSAENHFGTWTLTFDDGKFVDAGCPGGTYVVEDGRVVITLGPSGDACGTAAGLVLFEAGWSVDGDKLTFLDVKSGHGYDLLIQSLFERTFTKIG